MLALQALYKLWHFRLSVCLSDLRLSVRPSVTRWYCVKTTARNTMQFVLSDSTSSSAVAEGPRDALSQLKSCQLLHNCTKSHI